MIYRNKKTGKLYNVISYDVTNATNAQDGQYMVLYCCENDGKRELFVRDSLEFMEKFEDVEIKGKFFKVIAGDPFGGYATIKENLSEEEADKLVEEVSEEVDYFTIVSKKEME